MRKICIFSHIIFLNFFSVQSQILYQCNYDGFSHLQSCFDPLIPPTEFMGIITNYSDIYLALSDVTAISKVTSIGEFCSLPYRIVGYSWDVYFCNRGSCKTTSGLIGNCTKGQYGRTQYQLTTDFQSFTLKDPINKTVEIDGINEQCLIYYFYLPTIAQNELIIIKEEIDGNNMTIDRVNSTPYNGWVERRVNFFAQQSKYKIYFEVRKVSATFSHYGMFDEISIEQGSCSEPPSTTIRTTQTSTTTTSSIVTHDESFSSDLPSTSTNAITTEKQTTVSTTDSSSSTMASTTSSTSVTSTMTTSSTTTTISPRTTMNNTSTVIITTVRTTTIDVQTTESTLTTRSSSPSSTSSTSTTRSSSSTSSTSTTRSSSPSSTSSTSTTRSSSSSTSSTSETTEKPLITTTNSSTIDFVTDKEDKEDSPTNNLTPIIIGVSVSVVVIAAAAGGGWTWHKRIKAKKLTSNSNGRKRPETFVELNQLRNESSF